ncbi:MAG: phosphoribosyl-ATP diphosphatase [Solirubrobacterales bacterium]
MLEKGIIEDLYDIIEDRKLNPMEGSYTNYLFEKGLDKILKKVGEECTEVIIGSKNNDKEEIINEICDLTYHILVLMAKQDIKPSEVSKVLEERRVKIGNKKAERTEINNY